MITIKGEPGCIRYQEIFHTHLIAVGFRLPEGCIIRTPAALLRHFPAVVSDELIVVPAGIVVIFKTSYA
jgi:hypothetical protein